MVFVPDGGAWKVALWQWQVSGIAAERAMWNDQYRRGVGFRKEPNRLLVRTVEGVAPRKALDLAMGQGRNALYLASRGWKVTGVDISDEGIHQARAAAAERNLVLDAVLSDVNDHDFGTARWDLVTMIYAGDDPGWIERAKVSLKPGGLFVFEELPLGPEEAGRRGIGIEAGKLAPMFAGWEIRRGRGRRGHRRLEQGEEQAGQVRGEKTPGSDPLICERARRIGETMTEAADTGPSHA